MSESLRLGRELAVLTVTCCPAKRNAMTADMYDGLYGGVRDGRRATSLTATTS